MNKMGQVILACVIALIAVAAFGAWLQWGVIGLTVDATKLAGLLAPIAFAAAIVERGVEVLISPWRDAGANKIQAKIDAIKARPADPTTATQNATELQAATNELSDYRETTQRFAFAVGLVLSVLVSIAGVRALGSFMATNGFEGHSANQKGFFLSMDVAVTALLLAGGADGLHSIVNAVTSFFNATADKAAKS
jgi:hypothetical protein